MTLDEFRQALVKALNLHFPRTKVTIATSRGIILTGKAEISNDTFVTVYFNTLTGKTSYALIHCGQRITGYDNYKFWHHHPLGAVEQHIPCTKPTPESALATLAATCAELL